VVYHAIQNAHRNLGRQTLMEPVEWTDDGWWRIPKDASPAAALRIPVASSTASATSTSRPAPAAASLSDDFSSGSLGWQWDPITEANLGRAKTGQGSLTLAAAGSSLHDSLPLLCLVPAPEYTIEADLTVEAGAIGGITIYYDSLHSCGIALGGGRVLLYNMGKNWLQADHNSISWEGDSISLRLACDGYTVTPWYSADGRTWCKYNICFDVEGWHHNAVIGDSVMVGLGGIRPGIFSAGTGKVTFDSWRVTR
jgi:beta-xylosidase